MVLVDRKREGETFDENALREFAMRAERPKRPEKVRYIQAIEVTYREGFGIMGDPCILKKAYWDFDGNFLAETSVSIVK